MIRPVKSRAMHWLKQRTTSRQRRRLKGVYGSARRPVRAVRRRLQSTVDCAQLTEDLRGAGICPGDVLMVYSSLSRIGNVVGGAEAVIESLMSAVTERGTILMPAFSDAETVFKDHEQGVPIDLRNAAAVTGKVSEVFRKHAGVRRSSHPFSSVCAWGRLAEEMTADHARDPKISHAGSPMGRMLDFEGKFVGLGVTVSVISLYHVVEDTWDGFPIDLYLEPRPLSYIDPDGKRVARDIRRYRPEILPARIDQPAGEWIRSALTEHYRRKGLLHEFRFGEADAWMIDARALYEELKRLATKGVTIYLTREEWAARGGSLSSW